MGVLFRRFWVPICTADRLPQPGGAPLVERLLGESFVVFRSKDGNVGVLDELCIHRNASLALGRVEDCGIRCIYHGWKFGTDGALLDIMNHPADRRPRGSRRRPTRSSRRAAWSGPISVRRSSDRRSRASRSWTCRRPIAC
ncbi:MAG: Rieske 2Fe-2S domain-containing protein [Pseudomonadota bacterium]